MSKKKIRSRSGKTGRNLGEKVFKGRVAALRKRASILAKERLIPPDDHGFSRVTPLELIMLNKASKGYLLALGDSWLDYFAMDILDLLKSELGYKGTSVADAGTSLKTIVKVPAQLQLLSQEIENTVGVTPLKAIVLSGGGNDFIEFGIENLLNDFDAGPPHLKVDAVKQLIDDEMKPALITILDCIKDLCNRWLKKTIPILIHGYDYPIPDGRFLVTPRRGPWLEPCFLNKGYDKLDLVPRTADMKALIDKLNIMQLGIAGSPGYQHVRHVELRGALKVPNYTTIWDNELHPRYNGFLTIAERFDRELRKL